MANIPVKWYRGIMSGAPQTSSPELAGSIVGVLDACLVDGFGLVTLDSIVVASGIATATRSAGMPFMANQVIEIAGATPSGLNGQWRVIAVDPGPNTMTFAAAGVSDGTATGTITCKTPGLGWERVFSSGNKRVFRSQNTDSPRSYFRVNDSQTATESGYNGASFMAYESMSDVDTGANLWGDFLLARNQWYSYSWQVVGDDRTVHFFWGTILNNGATGPANNWQSMGDFVSFAPADAYNDLMQGSACYKGVTTDFPASLLNPSNGASLSNYRKAHRSVTGALGPKIGGMTQINIASGYGGPTFPSPLDNGMMVTDVLIRELNDSYSRPVIGRCRGIYWVLANTPYSQVSGDICAEVTDIVGLEGRRCWVMSPQEYVPTAHQYLRCVVDVTGPWD